ncbi:MAG: ABC transporter permease, partial [Methanocella sp.]
MTAFLVVSAAFLGTLVSALAPAPEPAAGGILGSSVTRVDTTWLGTAVLFLWAVYAFRRWQKARRLGPEAAVATDDVALIGAVALLLWELLTSRFHLLPAHLFPRPVQVVAALVKDRAVILGNIASSLGILAAGYGAAVALAVPLGLLIGWRRRLFGAVYPVAKAMAPIPPTVYVPYAITLLPTFWTSSVFVVFAGSFWPIFMNTLNGVFSVDRRLIDSARCLGVPERTLLRRVILPGALPSVFGGAMIGLLSSFIMLTIAEMIGAKSGLGWYIQYFADFASYDRVTAGIVVVAVVVGLVVYGFDTLKARLTRWQAA